MSGSSPWLPSTPGRAELPNAAAGLSSSASSSHRVFGHNVTNSAPRQHLLPKPTGSTRPVVTSSDASMEDQSTEVLRSPGADSCPLRGASPTCATPQGRQAHDTERSNVGSKRSRSGEVLTPRNSPATAVGSAANHTSASDDQADSDEEPEFATDPEVRFGDRAPRAAAPSSSSSSLRSTGERTLFGLQKMNRDNIAWNAELESLLSLDTLVPMPNWESFLLDEAAVSALLDGFAASPHPPTEVE